MINFAMKLCLIKSYIICVISSIAFSNILTIQTRDANISVAYASIELPLIPNKKTNKFDLNVKKCYNIAY